MPPRHYPHAASVESGKVVSPPPKEGFSAGLFWAEADGEVEGGIGDQIQPLGKSQVTLPFPLP